MKRICRFFEDHPVLAWAAAMSLVVLWYLAMQALIEHFFSVKPGTATFWIDLSAHLLVATALFLFAHNLSRFALAMAALFSSLTLGNALKISILGGPLMPDDFSSAKNMFLLLDGWLLVGAGLMVAIPTLLLGWMFAWRRISSWVAVALLAVALGMVLAFPEPVSKGLDQRFGDWVWNQRGNYEARGLPLHLLQEGVRSRARREPAPTAGEVARALERLGIQVADPLLRVGATDQPRRNLHMIVLESFWDPVALGASELSADPIDPNFRTLWAATGHSRVLVPVFGGYTANTEFEALCGFPVERDNVFFEGALRRTVPCLPRHLEGAGYRSFASHPNVAAFWNRVNAYQRLGFGTYWSSGDFELDDMNGSFLGDASLYAQVLDRLSDRLAGPEPVFNYVLTYFGHLPYPLNARRPAVITAAEGHETVAAYANTMYYKSRELMEFLGTLRQRDPDALIVLFGDHLPALGNQFGGFRESGLLASTRGEFSDAMFHTLTATPLIIINGRHGVMSLGDLPLYQLPGVLLTLLGDSRPSMLHWTGSGDGRQMVRPLPGLHFFVDGNAATACRGDDEQPPSCEASSLWMESIRVLMRDLFSGAQHSLQHFTRSPDRRSAETPLTSSGMELSKL